MLRTRLLGCWRLVGLRDGGASVGGLVLRARVLGCWWLVGLREGEASVGGLASRARVLGCLLGWCLEAIGLRFFDGGPAGA